jgi:hypothetical protein
MAQASPSRGEEVSEFAVALKGRSASCRAETTATQPPSLVAVFFHLAAPNNCASVRFLATPCLGLRSSALAHRAIVAARLPVAAPKHGNRQPAPRDGTIDTPVCRCPAASHRPRPTDRSVCRTSEATATQPPSLVAVFFHLAAPNNCASVRFLATLGLGLRSSALAHRAIVAAWLPVAAPKHGNRQPAARDGTIDTPVCRCPAATRPNRQECLSYFGSHGLHAVAWFPPLPHPESACTFTRMLLRPKQRLLEKVS